MKTVQDLRNLLDKIDSIQKHHLDKYREDNSSITSDEIAAFNCTIYQLGKAYDVLMMAVNGDWGF